MRRYGCSRPVCVLALVGAVLVLLGVVAIPVCHHIIQQQIIQRVVLVPGHEVYEQIWREPPVPIRLQVWVFHLLNPDKVEQGGKPQLEQRGPYTYAENRKKVDISHNKNGTVTYRQIKTYHFLRNESIGWDNETFITINLPLVALSSSLKSDSEALRWFISRLASLAEKLFIERTVREIVWGYKDEILALGKVFKPSQFYTDIAGVLAGKNDTDDGVYTIFTGETDIQLTGVIDKYNGSSHVDFWTTSNANMVNGSDGTVCPPFVNKDMILPVFSTDICRSVYGTFHGETESPQGILLYRFTAPRAALAKPSENPNNAGFCTPFGHCMGTGVLNISTCQKVDGFEIPIVISYPHFYLAEQQYIDAVDGMHPDPIQHATDFQIEPNTGLVMVIYKRIQVNAYIEQIDGVKQTEHVKSVVYPVLWMNESAVIDDAHAHQVQTELLTPMLLVEVVQYCLIGIGALLIVIALAALLGSKYWTKGIPSETDERITRAQSNPGHGQGDEVDRNMQQDPTQGEVTVAAGNLESANSLSQDIPADHLDNVQHEGSPLLPKSQE